MNRPKGCGGAGVRRGGGAPNALVVALALLCTGGAAAAQDAPAGPRPGEIETAPIQCWWRTDTAEVRIGQRFTITLTCGVIETSRLRVVASTNQLDPGAVQLTPFEVVSGTRRDDVMAPPWRYFQYDYRVRLLSEGFFGQDVTIPELPVTYTIQAAAGGGAQGRDQIYRLPALPLRVASLVPRDAADIRDAPAAGFEAVEARRFRAASATLGGVILLGFAGVLVVAAGVRAASRVRGRRTAAARPLAPAIVLTAGLRSLEQVKAGAAGEGWTTALARQALAAVRAAAAVGLGRPVVQSAASRETAAREGQLLVRRGLVRRRHWTISAATTAPALERGLGQLAAGSSRRTPLAALRAALGVLTAAAYARDGALDAAALDAALEQAVGAMRQMRLHSLLPTAGWPGLRAPAAGLAPPAMGEERL